MSNANDLLMGGGVPAAKFATLGTAVSGRVVREPEAREQTDFTSGEVLRWANGDARMQIIVHLETDERDDTNLADDGTRAVYIKGQMLNAVRAAVRAAGANGLEAGGTLTVTYVADAEPTKRGFNGAKQYTATYRAPAGAAAASVLNAGDAPTTQAAPAATAQPAPVGNPPPGIDPNLWAQMTTDQRASVLAVTANVG